MDTKIQKNTPLLGPITVFWGKLVDEVKKFIFELLL